MALVESTETSYFEDFVKRGDKDEIIKTSKMKITKRVYPCRPQVNERRTWAKFGQVQKIPRGSHSKGDFSVNVQPIAFETDEGNDDEQLDLVKQIKMVSQESTMMKNLRSGK